MEDPELKKKREFERAKQIQEETEELKCNLFPEQYNIKEFQIMLVFKYIIYK